MSTNTELIARLAASQREAIALQAQLTAAQGQQPAEPGVYLIKERTADDHELHKVFDGTNWHFGAAGIAGALQSAEVGAKGGEFDLKGPSKQPLRIEILSAEQAARLAALDTAQPEPVNEWKEAVINELVVAHILTPENSIHPRKAVQDVVTWRCQVALDPTVSSEAQALVDSGKAQVNAMLVEALKDTLYSLQVPLVSCQQGAVSKCKCRKCVIERGEEALTAAKQAQPERATSTKGSDQVWFAQNYKQGGQHD